MLRIECGCRRGVGSAVMGVTKRRIPLTIPILGSLAGGVATVLASGYPGWFLFGAPVTFVLLCVVMVLLPGRA